MSPSENSTRTADPAAVPIRPRDLRLLPIAAVVWLVTGVSLSFSPRTVGVSAAVMLVVAGAGVAGAVSRRSWWRWVALPLAAAAALGGVAVAQRVASAGGIDQLAAHRATAEVTVRLTSDVVVLPAQGVRPQLARAPAVAIRVDSRGSSVRGRVPVVISATGPLADDLARHPAGSTLRVLARLASDERDPLNAAQVRISAPPEVVRTPGPGAAVVNRTRAALVKAMIHSPPDQAGLVPSLVVGDTSHLPDEVVEQFKATGLTHLTAVSGSNLTLLVVFLLTACRWVGVRGRWLWLAQLLAVVCFVVLCRAEPSVIRAAAMGLVALGALGRTRDVSRGVRHLAGAVMVVLLLSPDLSRSWGFALSAVATAGIVVLAPRLLQAAQWMPRGVAEAIVVSLCAQIATTPLVASLAGTISISGVIANIVVAPFVGPATVMGLVAAVIGTVWAPLGIPFGWLAGWCTQPMLLTATLGSRLPGGVHSWPVAWWPLLILVVACVVVAWLMPWILARPVAVAVAFVLLVVTVSRPPVVPGWPGHWQVVFCSVGQGDATVIRAGPHSAIVVDTGPEAEPTDGCLTALGITDVPLLVLTHYHADHVGGLDAVLKRKVGLVVTSGTRSPEAMAVAMERRVGAAGVPIRAVSAGETFTAGQASYLTLQSPTGTEVIGPGEGESSAENDSSVVGLARSDELTVLLPGDIEPAGQQALMASGRPVGAMVLKMPHHGSARQDENFWRATGARLAVVSAGVDNDYGHPAPKALALAQRMGMQVVRTDTQGSIALRLDRDQIEVRTVTG